MTNTRAQQPDAHPSDQSEASVVDGYLAAILRGEADEPLPTDLADLVPERALYHGVSALLVADRSAINCLPPAAWERLQAQALGETMWDLRHRQVLVPVLTDLAQAGVRAVLLKGTALAYSVYASSAGRPRGDTDILVAVDQVAQTRNLLARHGFVRTSEHAVDRMPQEEWIAEMPDGSSHAIDLHWNLLRPWALASLFDTAALLAQTLPVPRLAPDALRLSTPMALLHACVHRASHFSAAYFVGSDPHYGGSRLIWLVDMDLLSRGMSDDDWQIFALAARQTGTAPLCLDALQDCARHLHTPLPDTVLHDLVTAPLDTKARQYFATSHLASRIWADMRALPPGQSRFAFIRELVFPSEAIMRDAYPQLAHQRLFRLHLHRFAERLARLRKERSQRRDTRA